MTSNELRFTVAFLLAVSSSLPAQAAAMSHSSITVSGVSKRRAFQGGADSALDTRGFALEQSVGGSRVGGEDLRVRLRMETEGTNGVG